LIRLVLAALLALGACARPPGPVPMPRYTLGAPYELGGLWSYPREDFSLTQTGLAIVLPDRAPGRRTANGEIHDPAALVAAHRTLQLPTVVTVTNLENGLQLAVRVNDRGPQPPGRVLGLSRRAAELLRIAADRPAQVRLTVDAAASRPLAASLPADVPSGPAVALAPAGAVVSETLAPIEGARDAARVRRDASPGVALARLPDGAAPPPERLPETLVQGAAAPGRLILELGVFFRRDIAHRQATRFAGQGARVEPLGFGRDTRWRVRLGPFGSVAEADAALAALLAAGATEIALQVE